MVTPAPYTTGATTKAPRPSQADDRLLPPRRMMTAMEADAERRIGRALATMRRALLDGLTDDNAHLMLARLESEEVLRPFTDTVMAVLTDVSLAGAQWGAETVNRHAYGAKGVIDFVWDIVNEAAERFARTYAYSLVTGITETTRTRLQGQISEFVRNQETINQLARRIEPLFGGVRAKMIAVTETTRAFAEGNQIAWRESGVIEQKRWVTANDELVCPVCGPLHRQVVDIDDEFEVTYATKRGLVTARFPHPPAHVSCRCGMTPVIVKVGDRVGRVSVQWQPAMSLDDAALWSKDSVYQNEMYHVTKGSNQDSLRQSGFSIENTTGFGRVFGNGVYVTPSASDAVYYADMAKEMDFSIVLGSNTVVTERIRLNILNPYKVNVSA